MAENLKTTKNEDKEWDVSWNDSRKNVESKKLFRVFNSMSEAELDRWIRDRASDKDYWKPGADVREDEFPSPYSSGALDVVYALALKVYRDDKFSGTKSGGIDGMKARKASYDYHKKTQEDRMRSQLATRKRLEASGGAVPSHYATQEDLDKWLDGAKFSEVAKPIGKPGYWAKNRRKSRYMDEAEMNLDNLTDEQLQEILDE